MKKVFFILILTLGWLVSNGQLYPPIQPYLENDYSLSQVKIFAMANTELSSNWRIELLAIVNKGLAEADEDMVLGENHIAWILDHVIYERRNLTFFVNSRRIGNKIDFFSDHNYDGIVGVFNYGKCDLVVFKTRCMNLLKVSVQGIQMATRPQIDPDTKNKMEKGKEIIKKSPNPNPNPKTSTKPKSRATTKGSGSGSNSRIIILVIRPYYYRVPAYGFRGYRSFTRPSRFTRPIY